jgi:type IV pilus assembly protein PilA
MPIGEHVLTKKKSFTPMPIANDDGFTLIELAVVILIIGILLLLAIPSFLGVRKRAQDKAAQSSLKVMLTTAKAAYGDVGNYSGASAASLSVAEPGYSIISSASASTGPKSVSIHVPTNVVWQAATWSSSKKCYFVTDSDASGTQFGKDLSGTQTACTAASITGTNVNTTTSW